MAYAGYHGAIGSVPLPKDAGTVKPTLTKIVRNQSSREGAHPVLAVLHTTEGPGDDLLGLASFFDQTATQASSHVANNSKGESVLMVHANMKAWTCAGYNRYTWNIEQMGFAANSRETWFKLHGKQLTNTAAWLAYCNVELGIPLRRGLASGTQVRIFRTGVVQHKNLGSIGGGHSDCGSGFPMGYVIRLARLIVEEHHFGRPHSKTARRLRNRVNRTRRRYSLPEFGEPRK